MHIWDLFGHNYTGALRFLVECWLEVGDGLSGITRVTDQQEGFPPRALTLITARHVKAWQAGAALDCFHCGFKR